MFSRLTFAAVVLACALVANAQPVDKEDLGKEPEKAAEVQAPVAAEDAAVSPPQAEEKLWFPFGGTFSAMFPGATPPPPPPPAPQPPAPVIFINPPPAPVARPPPSGVAVGSVSHPSGVAAAAAAASSGK